MTMTRVRRRRATRERPAEPTPTEREAFGISANVMRERVRRLSGEPHQMTDAEFAEAQAWVERFRAESLAAWHAAHPEAG
jgi:hypothetical protein